MKKTLVALFTMIALSIGAQVFAACPCQTCDPCPKPCECTTPCCESWLDCQKVNEYFCKIGLNECQKAEALNAIEKFRCKTQNMRCDGCKCESKCECRAYRKAIRALDCDMKAIITKCQKADYKCVKKEIKDQVKCCHHCLINPFARCKCACK